MGPLIQRFKFGGDLACGRLLADLMRSRQFRDEGHPKPDALIPVPLHRARLIERGFNQSQELALHLGRDLDCPVMTPLVRVTDTESQTGQTAAQRRANLARSFRVESGFSARHVLLIDDVMTTGTTAHRCAQALKRAGAERVDVWVCARA